MAVLASKKKKTSTKQKLSKRHTRTPTRGMAILVPSLGGRGLWERECGMAITLRMHKAISPGQWQPWTAVSSLQGLISKTSALAWTEYIFIVLLSHYTIDFMANQVIR